jgi:hypothetical protein
MIRETLRSFSITEEDGIALFAFYLLWL